jgi:hypothetical protein
MAAMATRSKREDEPADEPADGPRTASRARRSRGEGDQSLLDALIEGLDEIVPGLEVVDRELVFEGGARVDLAAVDPSGRLFFVLLVGEDADRAALEALDALRVLREELDLLVRHVGDRHVNPERAPRLLVISPISDERLARRLAALGDSGVAVLGLRSVKSASGERSYLTRLDPREQAVRGASGAAAFLRALPARLEALGSALVERMGRMDEELEPAADTTTLVWRLEGEVLCRVERVGDLLQASVGPDHQTLPLGDVSDLERLAQRAMARLTQILGMTRPDRPPAAAAPRPARTTEEGPILTDEEIQAFRE